MTRLTWRAGPDGIGHLHLAGGRLTACRVDPIGEQYAWPIVTRCPSCGEGGGVDTESRRPQQGPPGSSPKIPNRLGIGR